VSRTGTTTRDRTGDAPAPAAATARGSGARGRGSGRWRRRRGPRHPLLVGAVLALLLATASWALWESPLFAVRAVQVDGVHADDGQGLSAAEVRDTAGLRIGTPLLQVDLDAAAARVRRLPQVAGAQVSRGWPDRVVVTVAERVPVAVVERAGQRVLVDAGGVVFDTITGPLPVGVVPLEVSAPGPADAATRAALAAVDALPAAVRAQVSAVSAPTAGQVTLTLPGPVTVLWGDGGAAAAKAAALRGLLDQFRSGALPKAAVVDVSAPDAVVLR
jgi:cell division protein FtsQ